MKIERKFTGTTCSPPPQMGTLTKRSRKLLDQILAEKRITTQQLTDLIPKGVNGVLFTNAMVAITQFFTDRGVTITYTSPSKVLLRIVHIRQSEVTKPKPLSKPVRTTTSKRVPAKLKKASYSDDTETITSIEVGPSLNDLEEVNFIEEKVDFSLEKLFFEAEWYFDGTMRHTIYDKAYAYILIAKAQQGDIAARNLLVVHNQRLILHFAKRYKNRLHLEDQALQYIDLLQEGTFGLCKAIEKFDLSLGLSFTTYAGWWIRQGISRAVQDYQLVIRMPVHMHERLSQFKKVRNAFEARDGYLNVHALADALGITVEEAYKFQKLDRQSNTISFERPANGHDEDEERNFADFLSDKGIALPDAMIDAKIIQERLRKRLKVLLTVHEYTIIEKRFGLGNNKPLTLEEIGQEFGVTRERIRQIEEKSLEQLEADNFIKNFGREYLNKDITFNYSGAKQQRIEVIQKENSIFSDVIKIVAKFYGVPIESLLIPGKTGQSQHARQVAMYLLTKHSDVHPQSIIRRLKEDDRSSLYRVCKHIEKRIEDEKALAKDVEFLIWLLKTAKKITATTKKR